MAIINWNGGSGNWSTATDWSTDTVPGSSDAAVIAASGGYTISITASISVGSIAINDSSATLADLTSGVTISVTANLSSAGQILVQSGAALTTTGGLTNSGQLLVDQNGSGGSSLTIGGTLTNSNYLLVGNGRGPSTVEAQGLSNTGRIDINGTSTQEALLSIAAAAPSTWTGTLNVSGDGLLEFGGTSGISTIASGAQINLFGTHAFIAAAGVGTTSNTALTGLSSNAGQFQLQTGAALTTTGGLTNSGQLLVDQNGSGGSSLTIGGTLTNSNYLLVGNGRGPSTVEAQGLSNTGRIDINGTSTQEALLSIAAAAPSTWTGTLNVSGDGLLEFGGTSGISAIGGNAQINLFGTQAFIAAADVGTTSNTALTALSSNAGQFQLQTGAAVTTTAGLANSGQLLVDQNGSGGSSLTIGGTLTNSNYLLVGNGRGPSTVEAQGLSNTGRIDINGTSTQEALLSIAAAAPSTWTGTLNVSGDGLLEFGGTSGISAIGGNAQINLFGTQAFIAAADVGTTSNTALTALSSNAGQFQLQTGAALTTTGGLTNGGQLLVDQNGSGGSSLSIGGTLTNSNFMQVGNNNVASTATAEGLNNTGRIDIDGGSTNQALLSVTTAAPSTWTGTLNVSGHGLLEFGGTNVIGAIASGAQINLFGAHAFVAAAGVGTTSNTALTGLTSNAGQLQLQSGAALTTTGGLTNNSNLYVDAGGSGGSSLTIGGTLTNSNYMQVGNNNVASTATAQGLSNTGTISIEGGSTNQATLDIAAAAPSTWTGTLNVSGDGLLELGGTSGISTIASGAQINLLGAQSFIAAAGLGTTSDSALSGLSSNAGQLQLHNSAVMTTTVGLTNSGNIYVDDGGSGGSSLTIGGTLTNSNYLQVGKSNLGAAATVSVAGLNNTGTISIQGGGTNQAVLNITSAALAKLTGTVNVSGNGLLEFASGSITIIAAASGLTLSNANSLVADQSDTTHNSALAGLQSVAGTLTLQGGSTVATTGALAVSGSLTLKGSTLTAAGPVTVTGNSATTVSIDATSTLTVTGGKTFTQDTGTTTVSGALNASTIDVAGGKMDFTNAVTAGAYEDGGDGLLEFDGAVGGSVDVTFTDATGTLQIGAPGSFAATIAGAEVGDVIHLIGTAVTGLNFANGTLTVSGSSGTVASLNFSGSYTTGDFSFSSDGSGGTNIVVTQGTANTSLWTNSSGTNWTTSADWSSGVPSSATNVLIGIPGTYTVTLTSTGAANSLTLDDANATLEIDSGASLAVSNDVSNAGTVNLIGHASGAVMTVGGNFINTGTLGVDNYDFFFNSGGSTLNIAGTLTNSGSLAIGNLPFGGSIAPATVTAQSLDSTGTIVINGTAAGKGTLNITGGAAPTTLTSHIEVNGNALLEFASGGIIAVAGGGDLIVNGATAFVADASNTTSDSALTGLSSNAGTAEFDNGAALTITPAGGTFINSGSFSLIGNGSSEGVTEGPQVGSAVTVAGNFVNSGTLDVDSYWFFRNSGGSTLTINGTLTNSGTLAIGNLPFGGSTAPATLTAQSLDSSGTIVVDGTAAAKGTLDITAGAAPVTLTSKIEVNGNALLEFASGGITAVAGSGDLIVNGTTAFIADAASATSESALTGLSTNAGTVEFDNGATLTITPAGGTFTNTGSFSLIGNGSSEGVTEGPQVGSAVNVAGNFVNSGTLDVDAYWFFRNSGGSTLTIDGTLTNNGTLGIGNLPFGGSTAPVLVTAQAFNNTGTVSIVGPAGKAGTLDIAGVAQSTLAGAISLSGVALMEFGSGSFTNIAYGGSLKLNGAQSIIADSSNAAVSGALSGLTANAGDFELDDGATVIATPAGGTFANSGTVTLNGSGAAAGAALTLTGGFDNTGTIDVDTSTAGGSTLNITGTLTNAATTTIGNNSLSTATNVTAAALDNVAAGTITLTGTTTARTTLDITGAPPSILDGSINVLGVATLEFASGSYTSIVNGAELTLNGSQAVVADSGNAAGVDGALSGLGNIAGTLNLLDASGVAIAGSLSNSGFIDVDQSNNSNGGSGLIVAGTLDNTNTIVIGNGNLVANGTLIAAALDNEGSGAITLSGGGNGASASLTVEGVAANAGNLQFEPGGFAEVGTLDNTGIINLVGSAGTPSNLGVIGSATNSGAIIIGASAQMGVTGTFNDSDTVTVAGTLDIAGAMTVSAFGTLSMQGGTIVDPSGASLTIAAGATLTGNGTIDVPVVNNGTITPSGGLLDIAAPVTGTGQLDIGPSAVLELGGATAETVAFGGNVGTLKLDAPSGFTGAITGLVTGDVIDLAGIQATSAVVNGSTLTVTAGSQTLNYQVAGTGLAGDVFAIENDGHGGSHLVLGTPGPVIAGPTTQTVFTGLAAVLGPLSIADPAAGSGTLTATVSDTAGLLSVVAAGAGIVGGSGTNALTFTGDLTDINTMLASLTYSGASAGTDTVQVQVTDAGNLTTAQSIAVTTEAVPVTGGVIDAPPQEIIVPGTQTALGGLSISDPYAQTTGQMLTINFQPNGIDGTFTATGPTGAVITGQGTSNQSITGTVSQINAILADADAELGANNAALAVRIKAGLLAGLYLAGQALEALDDLGEQESRTTPYPSAPYKDSAPPPPPLPPPYYIPPEDRGMGDAYFLTSDGLLYNFDAVGEFVFAQSIQTGDAFEVQVRLQPSGASSTASVITQVAAGIGSDSVTFGIDRQDPVWVNGIPTALVAGETITLGGGQLSQISTNTYQIAWNTGEVVTVTNNLSYLDLQVGLPSGDAPGSVVGLVGPNGEGSANDFTLPNGTVLQQPLTTAELYGTFANAWRVTQATSLFNYGSGQTTATFTDPNFPEAPITLADLPSSVVAQAAQAVAATGLTDPGVVAAAELEYIASGGNLGVLADVASQLQATATIPATITPSSPAPAVLGVMGSQPSVDEAQTGSTAVTFDVYLTAVESSDTTVDYTAIASDATDLNAQDFGGTFPSGAITIAAGDTTGQFTIDVPQGALGTSPSDNVAVQISSPNNVPVFAPTAQETVTQPAAGPPAVPQLEDLTKFGSFTQSGNNYTLDLGAVQFGEVLPELQFGIVNAATAPADQLIGTFTADTVAGFGVIGDSIPSPIDAGTSYQGLTASINQDKFGANSETITFNPVDTNASGFSAPLAPITLTIADTLELPGMIYSQAFGDVHIITYNGLTYDFQATGDYVLAQSRILGDNFQIQMQLAPWLSGSSVTTIHEVAIALGADDVTFAWSRPNTVLVDGAATTLSMADPTLTLSGGTITEVSPDMFKVNWNTGETMTVSYTSSWASFLPSFIDITDGISGTAGPGAYAGLQGEDEGTLNDIQLADGTVLPQPVTTAQLYGEYANSWAVSAATSLFDAPLLPTSGPADPLTLADLPQNLVNQAAALVAAAGITDPGIAQAAELDYLATGDPSFITADETIQQFVSSTTPATVTGTPATAVGVAANAAKVTELASGETAVTFTAYLTGTETSDTEVDYTVVTPGGGFLGAAAFGGTLPSGNVTIAAGQTTAQFTVEVPQGSLGSDPSDNLQVEVSDPAAIPIFAPTAQTEIVNDQPEPGNPALPVLAQLTGDGTLSFNSTTNTYTLNLGGLVEGSALQAVQLAVVNAATPPADSLDGTFTPPTGTGFIVTGNNLPAALAPGDTYQGLYVSANNFATGTNSMTMTFDPTEVNDSGYSAALAPITLDITDTVTPAAVPQVNTPTTIVFPNVRVGSTADSQHVSITNTATTGAQNLDVTLTASGTATAAGSISQLAPGATDASDLSVGIDTSTAGALAGSVTENFVSDGGGGNTSPIALQDPYIDVFGGVYNEATAATTPLSTIVHVGDPGSLALTVGNTAEATDGYSEALIASLAGTIGGFWSASNTPSGDIAPGANNTTALKLGFSTLQAAVLSGSATVALTSDGGTGSSSIDGLGKIALAPQVVPVSITVDNYAKAALAEVSGGGTFSQSGNAYTLNLGNIAQGSAPRTIDLEALNAASGPADLLSGTFQTTGSSAFTPSGFAAFSGLAAGGTDTSPTLTLDTSTPGLFTETITLHSTGSNASGYSAALSDVVLTVTGDVQTPGLTIDPIDNGTIDARATAVGVPITGTVAGLSAGATFQVSVTDGAFSRSYTATVNADGSTWLATIPPGDVSQMPDGTATVAAEVNSVPAQRTVAVEVVPTVSTVTLTVQTPNGIDLSWPTLYDEMANSPIEAGGTGTGFTLVDSGALDGHTASIKFAMTGSGLSYSGSAPDIQLTGGLITGIEELDASNNVLATFTNFLISAVGLQAALNSYAAAFQNSGTADPTALNALFLADQYQETGGAGNDHLQGGNLSDLFHASAGNDAIDGGADINVGDYSPLTTPGIVAIVAGGDGVVNKGGNLGEDTVTGVQVLIGTDGDDVFYVDADETVAGGPGFNYLIELTPGVDLSYGTNFTQISEFVSNVGNNTVSFATDPNIAYIYGSTGNDTLTLGSGGGYLFSGGGGNNVLTGGANAVNFLIDSGGSSIMNGGGGSAENFFYVNGNNDQVNGAGAFNVVTELTPSVTVQVGAAQYRDVQEVIFDAGTNQLGVAANDADFLYIYGGSGNDTLTLGSGGGYLLGGGGTNVLNGGDNSAGTDIFIADDPSGSDTMSGGAGTNIYYVNGNSIVHGAGAFNLVSGLTNVNVQLGSAQYQDVQQIVLNGGTNNVSVAANDSDLVFLNGGAGNDTLTTGSGGGYLIGGGGTNTLNGGGGLNIFVADGGAGIDTMNGGSGSNIYYIDNNSTVHGAGTFNTIFALQQNVSLAYGSAQLGTDIQEVVLNGGTNTVDFSADPNAIYLYGGAGNDTLFGGAGNGFLYGGAGTNTFGFKPGWGMDTIMDWTTGTNGTTDQIDLTALATQGVHAITDLTQTIVNGSDVITSSHTGANSITLNGFNNTLTASSFHFA